MAVDAETGAPVVFDRDSGVALVDAVAAGTSNVSPTNPPDDLDGHRYLNGGYRRSENADLAVGHERVLILSPFGGRSRMPAAWRMGLADQVADLEASGSRVRTVVPEDEVAELFGPRALDPTGRPAAARAGHAQAARLAPRLRAFWPPDTP